MTVTITDKRGKRKVQPKALQEPVPPPWWPVFIAIEAERIRQLGKWGPQQHPDGTGHAWFAYMANEYKRLNDARAEKGTPLWSHILLEEVFEAMAERDTAKLREELVQSAAVISAWIEDIDSRGEQ